MKTKEINIYKFAELTDKAKMNAINQDRTTSIQEWAGLFRPAFYECARKFEELTKSNVVNLCFPTDKMASCHNRIKTKMLDIGGKVIDQDDFQGDVMRDYVFTTLAPAFINNSINEASSLADVEITGHRDIDHEILIPLIRFVNNPRYYVSNITLKDIICECYYHLFEYWRKLCFRAGYDESVAAYLADDSRYLYDQDDNLLPQEYWITE